MKKRLNTKAQFRVSFNKGDSNIGYGVVVASHDVKGDQYFEIIEDTQPITYVGETIVTDLGYYFQIKSTYLVKATNTLREYDTKFIGGLK